MPETPTPATSVAVDPAELAQLVDVTHRALQTAAAFVAQALLERRNRQYLLSEYMDDGMVKALDAYEDALDEYDQAYAIWERQLVSGGD